MEQKRNDAADSPSPPTAPASAAARQAGHEAFTETVSFVNFSRRDAPADAPPARALGLAREGSATFGTIRSRRPAEPLLLHCNIFA
jgi:hypothetical protein